MRKVEPSADTRTPFQSVLKVLLDERQDFPRALFQTFSDLDPASLKAFMQTWPSLSLKRKKNLLAGLLSILDSDTLVSFEELGRALLDDPEPVVLSCALL